MFAELLADSALSGFCLSAQIIQIDDFVSLTANELKCLQPPVEHSAHLEGELDASESCISASAPGCKSVLRLCGPQAEHAVPAPGRLEAQKCLSQTVSTVLPSASRHCATGLDAKP